MVMTKSIMDMEKPVGPEIGIASPRIFSDDFGRMAIDDLREQVTAELPQNVIALMERIESFAGREIEFGFNDRPAPERYPNAAASYVFKDRACILLRKGAPISPQDVLHELLHVQRYWMERIPQLEPLLNHRSNWDVTSRIENTLEHLIIVPREVDYGFEPRPAWDEVALSEWNGYPWPDNSEPFSRKLGCCLAWLVCEITTDPNVRVIAKDCLEKERLFETAERLRLSVRRHISNKSKLLLLVLRAIGLPRSEFRLAFLDAKKGEKRHVKLPIL